MMMRKRRRVGERKEKKEKKKEDDMRAKTHLWWKETKILAMCKAEQN